MNPFKYFGKSYTFWLLLVLSGEIAFYCYPNSPNLPALFLLLGTAGSAVTYRAKKDDDKEIEMKKIGVSDGKL